ncbi:MAG: VWA domain-containing protein [Acidobacteriota bacterium]
MSTRPENDSGPNSAGPPGNGQLLHNLLLFGRICKGLGMKVTPHRMIETARALKLIDLGKRSDVYQALCSFLVTRRSDLELFDEAFRLFWQRPAQGETGLDLRSLGEPRRKRTSFLPRFLGLKGSGESGETRTTLLLPTYSPQEWLRHKDFAEMTGEEVAMAREMMKQLNLSLGTRRTRRLNPGRGGPIDLRRTVRRNLRYGGEALDLPTRTPKRKPRPLVLICDISGSMERYTRLFLHFMHTLASQRSRVESFVFGTRLTRITLPVRMKSVDRALSEVGTLVKDWGGGTQTGAALATFNYRWSRRVLGRGALALLITDGWDRGDSDLLGREMARLQRSCKGLVWLNPLLGGPQYEPLTRGAQAMLPFVDEFLPLRNLENLERLGRELSRLKWPRR